MTKLCQHNQGVYIFLGFHWGGNWMWDDIDFVQETTQDLKWVAEGMQNNTLVWTMDGSYNRKWAADLSGVGWIIFCKEQACG
jgi:hypothetical protein